MIPKGLVTQILLVLMAIGMVFLYIRPQFAYISDTQDLMVSYKTEQEKVATVNSRLSSLVRDMNDVSANDRQKLLTYLPQEVDSISVQRDIKQIVQDSGAIYRSVSYSPVTASRQSNSSETATPEFAVTTESYSFKLDVEGTYSQIKNLLSLLERNEYPLEIQSLNLSLMEGGFMEATIELYTYGLKRPLLATDEEIDF